MVKFRDGQYWGDESTVEYEDHDAIFWHDPDDCDRDDLWSDEYLESHHGLESVDEHAMYQGLEDPVYDVGSTTKSWMLDVC